MNTILYILTMAGVTFILRILPLTLIRKPITNRFLQSFFYYVPYVTLSLMVFPDIIEATASPLAGAAAMSVAIVCAWLGLGLVPISAICCALVFVLELFL